MALKPKPFPKSMAACADLLYDLKEERLAADRAAASLKEREEALKTHIIDNLPKDSGGAVGKHHKVIVDNTKKKPRVVDWDAFYAYIAKTKQWDLLQRRAGEAAIAERWDAGKSIPGVEKFNIVTISLTKV